MTTSGTSAGAHRRAGAAALVAGGALFFVGGGLHPSQDPPDVTLDEHLHLMFEDPGWYPAHAVLLAGMALMTAGLALLARSGRLDVAPAVRTAGRVLVAAAGATTVSSLLHLVMAVESDDLAAGAGTPLVDLNNVVESVTVPAFGLALAAFAVLAARARLVGNRPAAALAAACGVAYALAGGTFLLTDALDPLFPLAGGIGVWAVVVGALDLRATRATRATREARTPSPAPARMSHDVHAGDGGVEGYR